jgi:hypothetical protein
MAVDCHICGIIVTLHIVVEVLVTGDVVQKNVKCLMLKDCPKLSISHLLDKFGIIVKSKVNTTSSAYCHSGQIGSLDLVEIQEHGSVKRIKKNQGGDCGLKVVTRSTIIRHNFS